MFPTMITVLKLPQSIQQPWSTLEELDVRLEPHVPWATETSLTELVPGCSRNHSMRCSSRARTCNATFICRKRAALKGDQSRGVATDAKPRYLVDGNIAIQHLAGANTTSAQTNIRRVHH